MKKIFQTLVYSSSSRSALPAAILQPSNQILVQENNGRMKFLYRLRRRNPVLFWYGSVNFILAIVYLILSLTTSVLVNDVNAFIKPFKFAISIGIFCWTMGYLMFYLHRPSKVKLYNKMAVLVFTYESAVIGWQAANGRLSHFNVSSPLYEALFQVMGLAIVLLTFWTAHIGYLFFKKKEWTIPAPYLWGIRLGILCFVVFALEGGVMGAILRHSVGGEDGSKGLPLVNWSRNYGDLRIAHFLGMHALQVFPLFGYYLAKSSKSVFAFVFLYVALVVAVLVQALMGLPLL